MKKNKTCTILAKAGHKLVGTNDEQAEWIEQHYIDEQVGTYHFNVLASIQEIMLVDNPIQDLVSIPQIRKISLDYDYKRIPINNHDTKPLKNVDEFKKYRQSVDYLRKLNQRASIDAVDYKFNLAKNGIRQRGSNKQMCARHLLRALLQGVKPFEKPLYTYMHITYLLKDYGVSLSLLKRAKTTTFAPNCLKDTKDNRVHIRTLLRRLDIKSSNNYTEYLELFLHKSITNPLDLQYL